MPAPTPQPGEPDLRGILERSRTVAVLGAHVDPSRPAHYVPAYLAEQGYRILPVNPAFAGQQLHGHAVAAALAGLDEPVDVVCVFRRSEALAGHLGDVLAMDPPPPVVWLQSGIRSEPFARALGERGIEVVQSRCMLAEHRALGIGPVGPAAPEGAGS